ncbi:MAG: 3(2),5-bisphosphate nucleotidase [Moraxellaceae bacterium]|jgi:3'(2'), 5'-bisphosphate nucleotidase|nr:3(2),5-bisphosphate nucleotidase [Moraxellaceae bacterium]
MQHSELKQLMGDVQGIAEAAGQEIMAIFRDESRWAVEHKADDSPLTAADLAAHRVILARLTALTPEIPVISEESEAIPRDVRAQWSRCWMVDPLDGTKEFIARSNEFTVNIALIENGEAILGVVHAPAAGIVYVAARGCGAWHAEGTTVRPVLSAPVPARGERAVRIVASRRHRGARDEAFCQAVGERLGEIEFSTAGSAFKICVVAEGRADLYPRFGPTMEWDTAAGQVVVEEAGGVLMDEQGRPFRYNQRDTLLNGSFIVAGAEPALWQDICASLPEA